MNLSDKQEIHAEQLPDVPKKRPVIGFILLHGTFLGTVQA